VILETILTSTDGEGKPNAAPMGVEWGEREIVVKPYRETTTFRNLRSTGQAVVNLVDEVLVYVHTALWSADYPSAPARVVKGVVLDAACSWREIVVREVETEAPRARFVCDVVHAEVRREFLGFSRARSAVIEATILATRTRVRPIPEILAELPRLRAIVGKTGGPAEREAMVLLSDFVDSEARALGRGAR
jgi:uncharacterized protein